MAGRTSCLGVAGAGEGMQVWWASKVPVASQSPMSTLELERWRQEQTDSFRGALPSTDQNPQSLWMKHTGLAGGGVAHVCLWICFRTSDRAQVLGFMWPGLPGCDARRVPAGKP